jgi:hypothetical protein
MTIQDITRRYLPLLCVALSLAGGYAWLEKVSPTKPTGSQQLVQLEGLVIKAEAERKRRNYPAAHAIISLRSGNNTYRLRSEDLTLLPELPEGTRARIGVAVNESILGPSLIWTVNTDSGFQRDYTDVYGYALPGTRIHWQYLLFCLFGMLYAGYMTLWRKT